jgi:hypothetical protein|nr:MAG TPA: hypothetical protein [Caudoviricetes sp.]
MEKITMDEVQIKLEQIEASLQLTLEGMCGDFTAVGNSTGENEKLLSLSACRRTNTVYAPALDLICDALAALSDRVGSAVR